MDHTASIARLAIAASAALVIGMALASTRQPAVQASPALPAREPALYVLNAGVPQGPLTLNQFMPDLLQVHSGDKVQWHVTGPHNIHFVPAGETVERVGNLLDPTIEEGASFTGGDANSGLQANNPAFTLVMELEPGVYSYQCDVHPGMHGTIQVLAADAEISSPDQVAADVAAFIAESNPPARGLYSALSSGS